MSHLHNGNKVLNRIRSLQSNINNLHKAFMNSDVFCLAILQQVTAIESTNGLRNELIK